MEHNFENPALLLMAKGAYRDGDAVRLMCLVGNRDGLAFVDANYRQLLERGIYEPCLLQAYLGGAVGWHNWPVSAIRDQFRRADRTRLLAAGDPLPELGSIQLFRGVAGTKTECRPRGFSWTDSLDIACWFAWYYHERYNGLLVNPTVYTTIVSSRNVLAYINDRQEREYVIYPPKFASRMGLTKKELIRRAKEWTRKQKEREKAEMQASLARRKAAIA